MRQRLLDLDPNEIVLHDVKRHPIGLLGIYFAGAFIFLFDLIVLFLMARNQEAIGLNLENSSAIIVVIASIFAILTVLATTIAAMIYKVNELIVTNESIILIYQAGLFNRKISQLGLEKIEDVTSQQTGILPHMFNYGTITIETAGEMSNFVFPYAPSPNITAKQIIEANEQFIRNSGTSATGSGHDSS
ncbi:PH domain-containing protein [Candidatus Saccharibacteria bacterium CPR2]|nr:PH domain-containing protein [Candidatus Saccharibacteria bacterium CPR2]